MIIVIPMIDSYVQETVSLTYCMCCGKFILMMAYRGTGYCGQSCELGKCGHEDNDQHRASNNSGTDPVSYGGSCGT